MRALNLRLEVPDDRYHARAHNNLQAGDIDLPWASIFGFIDVLALMAVTVWLAVRHQRRRPPIPATPRGA